MIPAFITIIMNRVRQKRIIIKNKMNNCLQVGDGYYYIYRLLDEINISSLLPVIGK